MNDDLIIIKMILNYNIKLHENLNTDSIQIVIDSLQSSLDKAFQIREALKDGELEGVANLQDFVDA